MLMLFGCASVAGVVVAVIAVQCLIWSGLVWSALCVRARVCVYVCASWCVRPFAAQFAFQTKYVALVDVVIERIVIFCDGCLNNRIQQNHQRCRLSRVSPARVSRLSCSCVADVKQQLLVSYAWLCKYC
jgi:hypothetical protein